MWRRSNKINTIRHGWYYLQNCKAIKFLKNCKSYKIWKTQCSKSSSYFMSEFWQSKSYFLPLLSAIRGNECYLSDRVTTFWLGLDDNNLGVSFEWGGAWVKMPRIISFSRNVISINLKSFSTHGGIQRFEKKFNKHSGERWNPGEFLEIWKGASLGLILKDLSSNEDCVPFCWF